MDESSIYQAPPIAYIGNKGMRYPHPQRVGWAVAFAPPQLKITLPNQNFAIQAATEAPAILARRVNEITLVRGGTINLTV